MTPKLGPNKSPGPKWLHRHEIAVFAVVPIVAVPGDAVCYHLLKEKTDLAVESGPPW